MKTKLFASLVLLPLLVACSGTNTGNPLSEPPGSSMPALLKSDLPRDTSPDVSDGDQATFAAGNRAFALDLYSELSAADAGANLFFSPFSISVALAMTYAGAEGDTRAQMKAALHFELDDATLHRAFDATLLALAQRSQQVGPVESGTGTGFELHLVDQLWGQKDYPFLSSYLDVLAQNYGAGLYPVDFADSEPTRALINDWVAQQTNQRILDLLPEGSIDVYTRFVLTNAIYMKASWLTPFDPAKTAPATFQAPGGAHDVSMMHLELDTTYGRGAGYEALSLPYLSRGVRMLLVLPDDGTFTDFTAGLDASTFDGITSNLSEYSVTLGLPKFSFSSSEGLKPALSALGMPLAFDSAADFTGIASDGGLFISDVFHQAFIALDEQGTEAAASTAVVGSTVSVKPTADVTFDRPFVFAVYDEPTGEILFLGQVTDPG